MRIVIDMQACQTPAMRNRGIGRYTLAHIKALARRAGDHRLILMLNNNFSETIEPLRAEFDGLLDPDDICVFSTLGQLTDIGPANQWRHAAAQTLYQDFIRNLEPDVFHQSCLFDALSESVTGILPSARGINSVTLYDLIPYQYPKRYLADEAMRNWYLRKLQILKNADLLLGISESSRQEAIELLNLAPENVRNISSAIGEHFKVRDISPSRAAQLRTRYGLKGEYVMYTGGIDFRKNIEGLLTAYGLLAPAMRQRYQLAIVCNVDTASNERLQREARAAGLAQGQLVLTGFVPEDDLVDLYNLASLFVFPSIHEGFGLPALEAMACGVPVLASNRSSLPEVVGRDDMLFDPEDPAAVAAAITGALSDAGRLESLRCHGLQQAHKFSWERTAEATLHAFEETVDRRRSILQLQVARPSEPQATPSQAFIPPHWPQRRLAFVAPLPPCESGIADYSAELLPELSRYYDIDVVTPQEHIADPWVQANFNCISPEHFGRHQQRYPRVLYQVGNSHFHSHMFGLLERRPGTVVLHDFFVSGILNHLQQSLAEPGAFDRALYRSHGYPALALVQQDGHTQATKCFPANFGVLAQAQGIIVHSEHSRELADQFYGAGFSRDWSCLPLLRAPKRLLEAASARQRLGMPTRARITASFGFLAATKLNNELLEAWLASQESDPDAHLVFVGRNSLDDSGQQLLRRIEASPARKRIHITGFVSTEDYNLWLAAADLTVQLRGGSRGETSAAVLDCLVAGKPLICNAHGSSAELPEGVVWRLPDTFSIAELADAIRQLLGNPELAQRLSKRALRHCEQHAPATVAARYAEAIERYAERHPQAHQQRLVHALRSLPGHPGQPLKAHIELASAVAQNTGIGLQRTCFIDISALPPEPQQALQEVLCIWLRHPPTNWRIEFVHLAGGVYQLACQRAARWLDLPAMQDQPLLAGPQDAWLHLEEARAPAALTARLRRVGLITASQLLELTPDALGLWLDADTCPHPLEHGHAGIAALA